MKDYLLPCALIHCLVFFTLNGQVETSFPDQPDIIEVNTGELDAFQNLEAGNYNLALEQFDQLLKESPHYISAFMGKAKSLFQLGQYQEAFDTYLKASEKDAFDISSLEGLGNSALFLDQIDLALSYYSKVLVIKPDHAKIYHAIAVSHMCKNDYLNAAESAKIASLMYNKKGMHSPYSLILAYFSYALMDDKENMNQLLNYTKSFSFSGTWPSPIIRLIQGEIESFELISLVQSEKQEIEAHTYIGLKLRLDREFNASKMHLDWVRKSKTSDLLEALIAKHIPKHS